MFGSTLHTPRCDASRTMSVWRAGSTAVRVCFPAAQVETPVVPSFEAALSQAEWDALKEERRLAAEAAMKVKVLVHRATLLHAASYACSSPLRRWCCWSATCAVLLPPPVGTALRKNSAFCWAPVDTQAAEEAEAARLAEEARQAEEAARLAAEEARRVELTRVSATALL